MKEFTDELLIDVVKKAVELEILSKKPVDLETYSKTYNDMKSLILYILEKVG